MKMTLVDDTNGVHNVAKCDISGGNCKFMTGAVIYFFGRGILMGVDFLRIDSAYRPQKR